MLWYLFYQSKTYNRKLKRKIKRATYLAPWARPTRLGLGPAQQLPRVVFLPARAGSSVAAWEHGDDAVATESF